MDPAAQAAAEAAAESVATSEAAKTEAVISAVVEAANERVAEAEANAEAISAAAMETERGRRIDALENEVRTCQTEMAGIRTALENLRTEITAIMSRPPEIAVINPPPAKSSSIPPNTAVEATTVETVTVEPGSESADAQKAPEIPQPVRRRRLI